MSHPEPADERSVVDEAEATDAETALEDEHVTQSGAGDPDNQPAPPPDAGATTDPNN